ncbi:hypothetical protein [Pseudoalteromonas sp. MMG007]|uniref:hypothetical protein n=1 Tax=Pseudoalteromonas sp. MMG007 TaxID=2822684 RepID=UPI001B388184|nr:hypothetical protein [Pseudoalteromonas sp. MMG007]MBQ4859994.1 hypothetical protein [Pseudoalteromonas sp. MMG007]
MSSKAIKIKSLIINHIKYYINTLIDLIIIKTFGKYRASRIPDKIKGEKALVFSVFTPNSILIIEMLIKSFPGKLYLPNHYVLKSRFKESDKVSYYIYSNFSSLWKGANQGLFLYFVEFDYASVNFSLLRDVGQSKIMIPLTFPAMLSTAGMRCHILNERLNIGSLEFNKTNSVNHILDLILNNIEINLNKYKYKILFYDIIHLFNPKSREINEKYNYNILLMIADELYAKGVVDELEYINIKVEINDNYERISKLNPRYS